MRRKFIKNMKKPPKIAQWILQGINRSQNREIILGDFEEFFEDILLENGEIRADLWYWKQALKSIPRFLFTTIYWRIIMLKNYLKIALRNVKKHKAYSFINVTGLSIGMACCILITLWVLDELSYDRFHENANNIFRIEADENYSGEKFHINAAPWLLAPILPKEIPEIIRATRISRFGGIQLRYKNNSFFEYNVRSVDPSFFSIFTLPFVKGNSTNAVDNPFSLVISESMAEKYFPGEDALGKVVTVENKFDFVVTGVMKDVPRNSNLPVDLVIPFSFVRDHLRRLPDGWSNSISTFVQLRENSPLPEVNKKITGLVHSKSKENTAELMLNPLKRIRLHSYRGFGNSMGYVKYIYIFSFIFHQMVRNS